MYKIISNLCLIPTICLFLSIGKICQAEIITDINEAVENVFSLIDASKFSEAKLATDSLITRYDGNSVLPEARYEIGARYEGVDNFEEEKRVFQQIIQNHPNSPFANKARIGISRAEAMSLISLGKYNEAQGVINKMAVDFANQTDLPEALFWITERFQRFDRFGESKQLYQQISNDFPATEWADKAKFYIARVNATSLIVSGDYNEAQKAIDKMTVDFRDNRDLPGALYWITDRYERAERYEDAKRNYQEIIQNYPDNAWVDKVKLNISWAERANLSISKVNIMALIVSQNYGNAKEALNKMVVDFAGRKELPETLYWITERYEQLNKFDEAKDVYEQIIQKFPDNPFADKAKLGLRRVDVMILMASQDSKQAEIAFNNMIADFKNNDELPRAVLVIGEKCLSDAKTPDYRQRALKIFEKVINELPTTYTVVGMHGDLYYCAGRCYAELQNYPKALDCFEKIVNEYTDSAHCWYAQFMMGSLYQNMKDKNIINSAEADKKTKAAFEALLAKYPACPLAVSAQSWLNQYGSN